ncbi:uncharacterized protein [Rutidosis leptorrhynchoides]|uniref:uncharacterized protein n=1 Tax=Rutidosis leptorrhynchoides TaxID=125765 RepID=UPI003A992A82
MATHIWRILCHKDTMWVRWIYEYRLKDRNFWDVSIPSNASWSWRMLLSIRDVIRGHFYHRVGNDCILWKANDGNLSEFSVNIVWETIRPRRDLVAWYYMVWYPQCIPRHSFLLWLFIGERLKTQDKIKSWEIDANKPLLCPLCQLVPDSHDHLFFSCPFAKDVWILIKAHMNVPFMCDGWRDIVALISPFSKRNLSRFIIVKLLFSASVYLIWQVRNRRLFKKGSKTVYQVYRDIFSTIRLKLMSIKWKRSASVLRMKEDWKIH